MADPKRIAELEAIRKRAAAATPGPWCWRGNIDNGDPYLTSRGHRDVARPDGSVVRHHAGDVLGRIPVELTRGDAIRLGVGDPDGLPEPKVDREPQETYYARYEAAIDAAREAELENYLTDEWGETRKADRLAFCTDWVYTDARKLAVFEVAPTVTDRSDPRVYRADITGIRHPDAEFIEHSRQDVSRLLAALDAVLERHAITALHRHTEPCDKHRYRGIAERSACPACKVVEWAGCQTCHDEFGNPARAEDCKERQAIAIALSGKGNASA
jgi:hypothetical protein